MMRSLFGLVVVAFVVVPSGWVHAADKPMCNANPGGGWSCPNPGFAIAADGSNQCTIELMTDTKGGEWKFSCTNQSASGDFSWTYDDPAAGKGVKEIGHCVYYCGQNTHHYVVDPTNPKQIVSYTHTVTEPKGPCGTMTLTGNKRTIHNFNKDDNSGVEIVENYDKLTGVWEEVSRRSFTTLSEDPPGTEKEAAYATNLLLIASSESINTTDLRWSAYEFTGTYPSLPIPILNMNDYVYIDGISLSDVLYVRPEFAPESFLTGVRFVAMTSVPLDVNLFATIHRPGASSVYYATSVAGALAYSNNVLAGGLIEQPIESTPLYASTAGMLDVAASPVPAVSEYGLIVLVLCGFILTTVIMQRRAAVERG